MSPVVTLRVGSRDVSGFENLAEAYKACRLLNGEAYGKIPWDEAHISAARKLYSAKILTRQQATAITNEANASEEDNADRSIPLMGMSELLVELIDKTPARGKALQQRICEKWEPFRTAKERDTAVAAFKSMLRLEPRGALCEELSYEHWFECAVRGCAGEPIDANTLLLESSPYQRNLRLAIHVSESIDFTEEDE